MYSLPSAADCKSWIYAARGYLSTTHQKMGYDDGTIYFGKHSRRLTGKIYYKADEIKAHGIEIYNVDAIKDCLCYVHNKIRVEFTVRRKWLCEKVSRW